jgi:hypothetical protein
LPSTALRPATLTATYAIGITASFWFIERIWAVRWPCSRPIHGLDALRGIAAMCVVGLHARAIFPMITRLCLARATSAVDFFLMLSGYLMARITEPALPPGSRQRKVPRRRGTSGSGRPWRSAADRDSLSVGGGPRAIRCGSRRHWEQTWR